MLNAQAIRDTISAVLLDVNKDDGKAGNVKRIKFSSFLSICVGVFWLSVSQNPYEAEKGAVLLETRMFNETPLNPHKCFDTLTKILHLLFTKVNLC